MIVILREMRNRLRTLLGSMTPSKGQQPRPAAGQTRDDRASSVLELRKEVRGLQQEITDVISARERGDIGGGDTAHEERLASLRSRLAEKQADLAKFQARI